MDFKLVRFFSILVLFLNKDTSMLGKLWDRAKWFEGVTGLYKITEGKYNPVYSITFKYSHPSFDTSPAYFLTCPLTYYLTSVHNLTCPLAKPERRRVQSLLKLRADTEPYCCPTAVLPRHHFNTCLGSTEKSTAPMNDHCCSNVYCYFDATCTTLE